MVCTIVGDVVRPVVVEVPMGTPLIELIEQSTPGASNRGSVREGGPLRASPTPSSPAPTWTSPVSYEGLVDVGSGLGAAGFIVYDDRTNMVEVARLASNFLYVESCGQCPPCKLGAGDITERLDRIARTGGDDGDVEAIGARLLTVTDATRCHLAVQEQELISSILRRFPEDVVGRARGRGNPGPGPGRSQAGGAGRDRPAPAAKRADWTYGGAAWPGT